MAGVGNNQFPLMEKKQPTKKRRKKKNHKENKVKERYDNKVGKKPE